jgi:hypothetical protein
VVAWLMIAALVFVFSIDSQALDDAKTGAAAVAQAPKMPDGERPPNTLALTPSVIMTRGLPGQSVTQTLSLTNYTPMTFSFEMIAQDVIVRDGKRVFVAAGEVPQSVAATAVFSKPTVTIAPGQSASVDVTVTLTKGTDIRAIVAIFQGTDKLNGGKGSVGMTASLGCLITFTASNNFDVSSAEVAVHPQTETQPLRVTVNLANAGTEPVIPEGVVALLSDSGKLVGKAPFAAHRLLPGERLEFAAEYGAQLPSGRYRAVTSFQFEDKTLSKTADFTIE